MVDDPPPIARTKAIAALRDALDRCELGRGRLVLLRGEPGIGKSTLANLVAREAAQRGFAVELGRAWELAEAPPYFPISSCLRSLGVEVEGTPEGKGFLRAATKNETNDKNAFRLWEDVLAALAGASKDKPVVWILEDVHAADLQTLDLLTFLVRPLSAIRALIVVTARKQDPRITERANQRLVRIVRDGLAIDLEPFDESEVAELATRVLGRALAPSAMRELVALTSGNPLFVIECVRAFQSFGAAPRSVTSLPHTIRQVVMERVDLLPDKTRRVLEAAAVLGRESTAAMIARMQDAMPANVIDAMLPAVDAGIVLETRPAHFAFTHILVRDAIEEAIPAGARATLHDAAEAALAKTGGDGPELLALRAHHALASMRTDGHAIDLGLRAARLLEDLGAFDRALVMYERVEDARRAGLGPPSAMGDRLHTALIAQKAGRHAESRRMTEEVLTWARARRDAELLAKAALVLGNELRPGVVDHVLVQALEEARRALGEETTIQTALGCRVAARLAAALQPAPDPRGPIVLAKDAIACARRLGDDALIHDVLHMALAALVDADESTERRPLAEELLDRSLRAGDIARSMRALTILALDYAELGAFAELERSVDHALELAQRAGHPRLRWRALFLGSMRGLARGDVALAERYIVEAQELAALTDDPALMLSLGAHLAGTAKMLHRTDEMPKMILGLREMVKGVPKEDVVGASLAAGAYAMLEDVEGAAKHVANLHGDFSHGQLIGTFFISMQAEAFALVGDRAECRRLRDKLMPAIDQHVVGGNVQITYDGPVRRVVGLLESALGDHEAAIDHLDKALAFVTKHALRTWMAQVHYDLGRVLANARRDEDAANHFDRAIALAEEIGMPGLLVHARARRDVLAEAGAASTHGRGHPSSPSPSPNVRIAVGAPVVMKREGDTWRIEHDARVVRVKDSRGMQLLARLVERPGEEIHVLALASDEEGTSLHDTGVGGELLDARARREYKARLDDLDDEIAEAERMSDAGRLDKLTREKVALEAEVKRALGLGGKARAAAGSVSERARVNVQRRLKDAIARIAEHDPATGRFFEKSVRTGTFCRFFV